MGQNAWLKTLYFEDAYETRLSAVILGCSLAASLHSSCKEILLCAFYRK